MKEASQRRGETFSFFTSPSLLFRWVISRQLQARVSQALQETQPQAQSQTSSSTPLETLGFKASDTALILDLIAYLAIENIAFYRFLDLNTCQALLSWLDYEYLDKSGKRQASYRTSVEAQCSTREDFFCVWLSW